ncbi:MAG: BrnA antitoxin family protein [Caulobacteraceae bacterium]
MSGNKRAIGSDLKTVDAHQLGEADYAEIPELTEEWFAKATIHEGGEPVRRGRPRAQSPKKAVNLRLSQRVLAGFRAGGPGWQTRINAALEQWLSEHADRA